MDRWIDLESIQSFPFIMVTLQKVLDCL